MNKPLSKIFMIVIGMLLLAVIASTFWVRSNFVTIDYARRIGVGATKSQVKSLLGSPHSTSGSNTWLYNVIGKTSVYPMSVEFDSNGIAVDVGFQ